MTEQPSSPYYWQGDDIRLRPMHRDDVAVWLADEHSDSEAVRCLDHDMDLPKSAHAAQESAERFAEFSHSDLRYPFLELRFQKYNIRCLQSNQPMIRHAGRLGCQAEGRLRRQIYTAGRYFDELLFGLTREEFDELDRRLAESKQA